MYSENVYNVVQLGDQVGTFDAPGSAVAASVIYPVSEPIGLELDRGSVFPKQDRGRNVRNSAGSGYHGIRQASTTLPSEMRFEDFMHILEMSHAGGVAPTGSGPYTWLYPFEVDAPSVIPRTIEAGNTDDASASPMRIVSALVNQLTLGFSALSPTGASPWTVSAEVIGIDREISALTGSLASQAAVLESVQGKYTRLYEGTTATAFASLAELAGSLKMFSMVATRNLVLRAYGGADDKATKFGFTDQANATFETDVAISATAKTDFHDIWNVASPAALGERRWRLKALGSGTKSMTIDMRVGIMAVPIGEADGERLFHVTGEMVDDATLDASHTISIVNGIAALS